MDNVKLYNIEELMPFYKYKAKLIYIATLSDKANKYNILDILLNVHNVYIQIKNDVEIDTDLYGNMIINIRGSESKYFTHLRTLRMPNNYIVINGNEPPGKRNVIYCEYNEPITIKQNDEFKFECDYFGIDYSKKEFYIYKAGNTIGRDKIDNIDMAERLKDVELLELTIDRSNYQDECLINEIKRWEKQNMR